MIGSRDSKNFIDSLIDRDLLQEAINWIGSNLEPEDVFSEKQLEEWAENNDYFKED